MEGSVSDLCGCLLICRSVTYAQRAQHVLQRKGYTATVVRPSIDITDNSCGFAVKISEHYLAEAIHILKEYHLAPTKVVIVSEDGRRREVSV